MKELHVQIGYYHYVSVYNMSQKTFENCEYTCIFFFFSVKLCLMSAVVREHLHLGQESLSVVQITKMSV